jgi:hypothetical protein
METHRMKSAIIAFLALAVSGFAANNDRDGNWWRTESAAAHVVYVTGVLDGLTSGSFMVSNGGPEAMSDYNVRASLLLGRATSSQLSEGLDAFYANYRNREIDASNALCLVAMQLAGTSDEDLAKWIAIYRQAAHATRR